MITPAGPSEMTIEPVLRLSSMIMIHDAVRPFASAAELLLVPQGTSSEILQNYRKLTPALSGSAGPGCGVPNVAMTPSPRYLSRVPPFSNTAVSICA